MRVYGHAVTQTRRFSRFLYKTAQKLDRGLVLPFILYFTFKSKTRGAGRGTSTRSAKRRNNNNSHDAVPFAPRISSGGKNYYGFPPQLMTRMRYCDTVALTSTGGTIGKYVYRVNDCFDPDVTGGGHQPMYRDTFAALYDFYAVHSARINVTIINSGSVPAHCGIILDDDVTTSTSYTTLLEQNNGKHKLLPAQTGSLSSHTFGITFNATKMFGWDPLKTLSSKTLWANSPNVVAALLIWAQPADLSSSSSFYANVEIDMDVMCSDLTTPIGS